ncbi:MAG: histidine kinase [Proteobacteria bacterium]|nr:histidine kinase [Pseudomonadota bacterium]
MKHQFDADLLASPVVKAGTRRGHDYFKQLRSKLKWQLLFAYVTPLVLLAIFFHFQYNATVKEGINNHLKSIAENRRNTVDLFIQERVSNLRNVFQRESFHIPSSRKEMDDALVILRQESPTFVDIGLFSPDGTLTSYTGPHSFLSGKDYSNESWFKLFLASERNYYISDVYLGFRGKPHFIIAVRRMAEGKPWILRASVDPEKFGEFVESSYLIEDAEAFIINKAGKRQTFSGKTEIPDENRQVSERASETHVTEMAVGGRKYLKAIAWLNENDWALVVRLPTTKAYAPLRLAGLVMAGIMLVALLFIVFVVLRNTRKLIGSFETADADKEELRHQLFNAAKLASVGEMAAGVAHEINNPLAIIYEEASMLKDLMDPQFDGQIKQDDLEERIDVIIEAIMRGRTITGKLLAFARPHEPEPESTNINLLVDRVIETRKVDLQTSNITVAKEYTEELPVAMVNRNQMDQVILNLLNNARDAMSETGHISVRTRLSGDWIGIDVKDTGQGMTPEIMEKIFFPFFTTKGVGKGTGLGLSISYGIIKALGGKMEVKSEVGKGTVFTILLREESGKNLGIAENAQISYSP